jgi:hypothetical protein
MSRPRESPRRSARATEAEVLHQKVLSRCASQPQHRSKPKRRQCAEMVASGFTGRTRPTKVKKRENIKKRTRDDVDVEKLEQAVQALVCMRRQTGDMERNELTVHIGPQTWHLQRLHRPSAFRPDQARPQVVAFRRNDRCASKSHTFSPTGTRYPWGCKDG